MRSHCQGPFLLSIPFEGLKGHCSTPSSFRCLALQCGPVVRGGSVPPPAWTLDATSRFPGPTAPHVGSGPMAAALWELCHLDTWQGTCSRRQRQCCGSQGGDFSCRGPCNPFLMGRCSELGQQTCEHSPRASPVLLGSGRLSPLGGASLAALRSQVEHLAPQGTW